MKYEKVYMGAMVKPWMPNKRIKYITFSVTDDCNLMCEYCYFTHKSEKHKLSLEIAKQAVDYILSESLFSTYDGVVWDFIGGEPTLEIELIDKICDYILYKMYVDNHKWLSCYRIMIGTNGLLYNTPKFQNFIAKHNYNLHVAITVDGSKEKHDLSRIKKDGSGSYDDVVRALPLWFKQIGGTSTKATFAHADLPYLKDSIINLWNLGFKNVMANVVFENVWHEGDDAIIELQLKDLADYIIENRLWNQVSVRFFSPHIGYPVADQDRKNNFCGSGNMLAIDYNGKFYPCVRFMNSALDNHPGRVIGDVISGINTDKIRAFNALSYDAQSPKECLSCNVSKGCYWCTGFNYDASETGTIFERQIFHCKLHKATVRANNYFWARYEDATGCVSPLRYNAYTNVSAQNKYLYILYNNTFSYCNINSPANDYVEMDEETYAKAIEFCNENNYIPVHVGFPKERKFGYYIGDYTSTYEKDEMTIDVINHETISNYSYRVAPVVIYRVNSNQIHFIFDDIKTIFNLQTVVKLNLVVVDYHKWDKKDLLEYRQLLEKLWMFVYDNWVAKRYIHVDVVTDNILLENKIFCNAGKNNLTIAPTGEVYPCSAYYYDNTQKMGTIDDLSLKAVSAPDLLMCRSCEVNKCNKCSYMNQKQTDEPMVPFEVHCVKANLELNAAVSLVKRIRETSLLLPFDINDRIRASECADPLISLRGDTFANKGLYDLK